MSALRIFYSYAHEDEPFRKELEKRLVHLKRTGMIEEWHDRRIDAGREWHSEINHHLVNSDIILLLISSDFLASEFCYNVEMPLALRKHEEGSARVVPIIVRPIDLADLPIGKLCALPTDARAISQWIDPDEAWLDIVRGIRRVCAEMNHSVPVDTEQLATTKFAQDDHKVNAPAVVMPFSVTFSFKRLKITSDLHRYSLQCKLRLVRPPAKTGFLLKLSWPESIRVISSDGLTEVRRCHVEHINYIELTKKYDSTLYPGQQIELFRPEGDAELVYEFEHSTWSFVRNTHPALHWSIFCQDSMPTEGHLDFDDLNIF